MNVAWHQDCGNMWPSSRDMSGGGPGHPPPEEVVRTQEIVVEVAMIPHPAPWAAALEGGSPRMPPLSCVGLIPLASLCTIGDYFLRMAHPQGIYPMTLVHASALPFFSEVALSHPHLMASDCEGTWLLPCCITECGIQGKQGPPPIRTATCWLLVPARGGGDYS